MKRKKLHDQFQIVFSIDLRCVWKDGQFASDETLEPIYYTSKESKDECLEKCTNHKLKIDESVEGIRYLAKNGACRCVKNMSGHDTRGGRFHCIFE